jgi:hypothetical protein
VVYRRAVASENLFRYSSWSEAPGLKVHRWPFSKHLHHDARGNPKSATQGRALGHCAAAHRVEWHGGAVERHLQWYVIVNITFSTIIVVVDN